MFRVILLAVLFNFFIYAEEPAKKTYELVNEPIDVVIPCTFKDLEVLNLCIEGIRKNGANIRRIIVVSEKPLTDQAEWFDEKLFPFDKKQISFHLCKKRHGCSQRLLEAPNSRVGWYLQQLIKLYAIVVIPDISTNVLVLDSDTVFLNPVEFLTANNAALFNPGTELHKPYFEHANRLLPGLKRVYQEHSGISHHMLMQRAVILDLFKTVESIHQKEFWKAFLECVNREKMFAGASEFEIYFNFAISRSSQFKIRKLKWDNDVKSLQQINDFKAKNYHYVSCHSFRRG